MRASSQEQKGQATGQEIVQPTAKDILCGKDKSCVSHEGSKRFRAFIETYRHQYSSAKTKYEKMTITKEIYERLKDQSCRFLKLKTPHMVWEELSPMVARDKVGHALRFANRKKRRKTKNSASMDTTDSSTASSSQSSPSPSPDEPFSNVELIEPFPVYSHEPSLVSSLGMEEQIYKVGQPTSCLQDRFMPIRHDFAPPGTTPAKNAPATTEGEFGAGNSTCHGYKESIGDAWSMMQDSIIDWDVNTDFFSTVQV